MNTSDQASMTERDNGTCDLDALASAWSGFMRAVKMPANCGGEPTPEIHRANEDAQNYIREYIIATKDMRLLCLLHLLGCASLFIEQRLWPEEYERIKRDIEQGLKEADDPTNVSVTHKQVMHDVRECISNSAMGAADTNDPA